MILIEWNPNLGQITVLVLLVEFECITVGLLDLSVETFRGAVQQGFTSQTGFQGGIPTGWKERNFVVKSEDYFLYLWRYFLFSGTAWKHM